MQLKLGQLISLEAGDFIPDQVAKTLAEIRGEAYRMPPTQLRQVLTKAWGDDFLCRCFLSITPFL